MSKLRNRVLLIGHLGSDPEVKEVNDKTFAKLSLATENSYKDKNGDKITSTDWHNLIAWGKTALFIEKYCKKGKQIAVEGRISYRSYEGQDGNKKYITEIIISEVLLIGVK